MKYTVCCTHVALCAAHLLHFFAPPFLYFVLHCCCSWCCTPAVLHATHLLCFMFHTRCILRSTLLYFMIHACCTLFFTAAVPYLPHLLYLTFHTCCTLCCTPAVLILQFLFFMIDIPWKLERFNIFLRHTFSDFMVNIFAVWNILFQVFFFRCFPWKCINEIFHQAASRQCVLT